MKYVCFLFIFFAPFSSIAQSNYHKGLVTTNTGETLTGYIDAREWENNPTSISFKVTLNDTTQLFSPNRISSFIVDFDKYISYTVKISLSATILTGLKEGKDTTSKIARVFLKQVTTGDKLSLYSYSDDIKKRFFIQDMQDEPVELNFDEYNLESSTRVDKRYIGQLIILANKYGLLDKLQNTIEQTRYNKPELAAVIKLINGNENTGEKPSVARSRFYLGAALNLSESAFTGNTYFTGVNSNKATPKFDIGIDVFANPNVQKLLFRFQVSFCYINPEFTQNTSTYSSYISQSYQYKQYNIAFSPQVIWNIYNKDIFKFYVDAGLNINYSTYSDNKYTAIQSNSTTSSIVQLDPYILESGPTMNFPFQAGIVFYKKIELFFSYITEYSYTKYTDLSLGTTAYNLGVHYMIGGLKKK